MKSFPASKPNSWPVKIPGHHAADKQIHFRAIVENGIRQGHQSGAIGFYIVIGRLGLDSSLFRRHRLFLDPQAFEPTLGKNGIDRELKKLRDAVKAYPGLDFLPEESQTIGGSGRKDRFSYNQRFGGPGEVQNRVLLEAGTASGRQPTSEVQLRSLLAQFLEETGKSLNAEDESSFTFRLLHFRRTFVEKMFALHSAVTRFQAGTPLGTQVRHYYDLYQLANTDEVQDMLKSKEYLEIRQDYDVISAQSFSRDYLPPENLSFANSIALFPSPELAAVIGQQYEQQCELLCYGDTFPSWAAVLARLEELKLLL